MFGGILLITAGILIALYPPLLSIIVAVVLILLGLIIALAGFYNHRLQRHSDNPVIELFLRF